MSLKEIRCDMQGDTEETYPELEVWATLRATLWAA